MTSGLENWRVFIDTSAFVALADLTQAAHRSASLIQERLQRTRSRLFTSNFVIAETHALAMRRLGRLKAWELLQSLDQSAASSELMIVRVEVDDETKAREIIRRYDDKDFSLVDASSFAVMERLDIQVAFSFDRHFEQYGFAVLRP